MYILYVLVLPLLYSRLLACTFLHVDDIQNILREVLVAGIFVLERYETRLLAERIDHPVVTTLTVVVSDDEHMAAVGTPACIGCNLSIFSRPFLLFSGVAIREVLLAVEGELHFRGVHALGLVAFHEEIVVLGIEYVFAVGRELHPAIHHLPVFVVLLRLDIGERIGVAVEPIVLVAIFKFKPRKVFGKLRGRYAETSGVDGTVSFQAQLLSHDGIVEERLMLALCRTNQIVVVAL